MDIMGIISIDEMIIHSFLGIIKYFLLVFLWQCIYYDTTNAWLNLWKYFGFELQSYETNWSFMTKKIHEQRLWDEYTTIYFEMNILWENILLEKITGSNYYTLITIMDYLIQTFQKVVNYILILRHISKNLQ